MTNHKLVDIIELSPFNLKVIIYLYLEKRKKSEMLLANLYLDFE